MSTWRYHTPSGMTGLLPPILDTDVVETVGAQQAELLLKARRSSGGTVVLTHGRSSNADRLAARRLVQRELLAGPNWLGNSVTGRLYVYTLTQRGRTCWLKVQKRA